MADICEQEGLTFSESVSHNTQQSSPVTHRHSVPVQAFLFCSYLLQTHRLFLPESIHPGPSPRIQHVTNIPEEMREMFSF